MDALAQIALQSLAAWSALPLGRKIVLGVSTLVGLFLFGLLVLWSNYEGYTTLLSRLSPDDASAVIEQLESDNIPYELVAGGSSIRVPKSRVHKIRLKLAGDGLPRGGGVGFELFDEQTFGLSRFAEQLNFKRGLEGELRRTITELEPVRHARVHIVLPKKKLFGASGDNASASVTLHLYSGRSLGKEQVQSVVHLVASAVEGLTPEAVTLVDSQGRILARGGEVDGAAGLQLDHQRAVESAMEARVRQMIARVVGPDAVMVQVSAELDFTSVEATTENFDPDTIALRSEQTTTEDKEGAGQRVGGAPGARSNLAGASKSTGTSNSSNKKSQTINYEVSKDIRHTRTRAGRLQRLSVALLVNGTWNVAQDGARQYVPRSQEDLDSLTNLAKTAVGFDAKRGDQIEVATMPFVDPVVETIERVVWMEILEVVWRPVLALLLLIVVLRLLRSGAKSVQEAMIIEGPRTVRELEASLSGRMSTPRVLGVANESMAELIASPPDPEKAANVLKGWLAG